MSATFIPPFNWSKMIDDLADNGLYINTQFLPKNLTPTFDQWFDEAKKQKLFRPAKIGATQQSNLNSTIRSDLIHWIEQFPQALNFIPSFLTDFQAYTNSQLFLNLKRYELHLSSYQEGSFYKTHIDRSQFQNQNRILTIILYLNPDWSDENGGHLVIYSPQDSTKVLLKIKPEFGTLVVFRSELFPHEVLPAKKERRALTGWFRNDE